MADYALSLSPEELERYRFMAEIARKTEADDWAAAGIRAGATVADIGCGPGAMLRLLAAEVGAGGRAVGVDLEPGAVEAARAEVAEFPQAEVHRGAATASGLPAGTFDVVMCRHVLAHNGGAEPAIVAHLAELVRPSGAVYVVDVDVTGGGVRPAIPELADLSNRYIDYQTRRGNDMSIGSSLGILLEDAGLAVETFRFGGPVLRLSPGMRGPQWAARDAMLAEGIIDRADINRWAAGFERLDAEPKRPWFIMPVFVAIGRRPA